MHPILFRIGSFAVHSYGVLILCGFLLGLWYAMSFARRKMNLPPLPGKNHITPDNVFDFSLIALFLGIAGARILFVLLNIPYYLKNPGQIIAIWNGGLSIFGSIVLGIVWIYWYGKRHNLSALELGDILAPGFAIGYAVGRIGCFLNGCCYGNACAYPWGVVFPDAGPIHRHPTELYATAMNLVFFAILDRMSRKRLKPGVMFHSYLLMYCIGRFIEEQFRKGATADLFMYGLTQAQAFIVLCVPFILYFLYRAVKSPAIAESTEPERAGKAS